MADATSAVPDGTRFIDGVTSKGKLIGVEDVKDESGDELCNTSMIKLKAVVLAKKEHKLPINIKISFEGLSILDQKTNEVLYKHAVEHISYISRDPTDPRAFGYIYKDDKGGLKYLAIKTQNQAAEVVLTLKDLFEVVYEKSKQEKAKAKEAQQEKKPTNEVVVPAVVETQQTTTNFFDIEESIAPNIIIEAPKVENITLPPPPQSKKLADKPPKEIDLFMVEDKKEDVLDFLDTIESKSPSSSADLFSLDLTTNKLITSAFGSTIPAPIAAFQSPPTNQFNNLNLSQSPLIPPINLVGSPFKTQLGSPPMSSGQNMPNYQQFAASPFQQQQQQQQPQYTAVVNQLQQQYPGQFQQQLSGQMPPLQQYPNSQQFPGQLPPSQQRPNLPPQQQFPQFAEFGQFKNN